MQHYQPIQPNQISTLEANYHQQLLGYYLPYARQGLLAPASDPRQILARDEAFKIVSAERAAYSQATRSQALPTQPILSPTPPAPVVYSYQNIYSIPQILPQNATPQPVSNVPMHRGTPDFSSLNRPTGSLHRNSLPATPTEADTSISAGVARKPLPIPIARSTTLPTIPNNARATPVTPPDPLPFHAREAVNTLPGRSARPDLKRHSLSLSKKPLPQTPEPSTPPIVREPLSSMFSNISLNEKTNDLPSINVSSTSNATPTIITPPVLVEPPTIIAATVHVDAPSVPSINVEPSTSSISIVVETPSIAVSVEPSMKPPLPQIPQIFSPPPVKKLHPRDDPSHPSHALYSPTPALTPSGPLEAGTLTCNGCSKHIFGRAIMAAGSSWHSECFLCSEEGCNEELEHIQYEVKDDKVWCMVHFEERYAKQCFQCKTPISDPSFLTISDSRLTPTEPAVRYYHTLHFFCAQCGDPFMDVDSAGKEDAESKPYMVHKGWAYCEACDILMWREKCRGCRKGVGDEWLEPDGGEIGKWHIQCFVCTRCKCSLSGNYLIEDDVDESDEELTLERPYCVPCFNLKAVEEAHGFIGK